MERLLQATDKEKAKADIQYNEYSKGESLIKSVHPRMIRCKVIEGTVQLTVNKQTLLITQDQWIEIPSNTTYSASFIETTKLLEFWYC